MKPENLQKINRELDGEDYDLNALVDYVIDKKHDAASFAVNQTNRRS
jgi:hypothetical protein